MLLSEIEGSNYLIKLYGNGNHEKTTFTIESSGSIVGTGTIILLMGTSSHEIYNHGYISGGYLIENNSTSFHFENSGDLVSNSNAFHLNIGWDENPISIEKNELAAKALAIMNNKKITSLCAVNLKNKKKTIGIIHIHNILDNITI